MDFDIITTQELIPEFLERVKKVSSEISNKLPNIDSESTDEYWYDWWAVNQVLLDLQDFLKVFEFQVRCLSFQDLTYRELYLLETLYGNFIILAHTRISNAPEEAKSDRYKEVFKRVNNVVSDFQLINIKLKEQFYQLIFNKISTEKKVC